MKSHRQRLWSLALSAGSGVLVCVALLCLTRTDLAAVPPTLPHGFVSELVVDGLDQPTAIDWTPDGRILVALKSGIVRVVQDGQLLPANFIDISSRVNNNGDRGLLGIAVDPDFAVTRAVYLLFTYDPPDLPGWDYAVDGKDGNGSRVARLIRVSAFPTDTNLADPTTEVVILGKNSTLAQIGDPANSGGERDIPSCDDNGTPVVDCLPADSPSHTIGTVKFGTDGSLYVTNGDGARYLDIPDPRSLHAQDVDSLAGKVLRIDPQTGEGYPDNPFYDGDPTSNRSRVWSYGMRNPFRLTIQPQTNEPFVGDVGWNAWEEINTGRGKNFGWPCYEGDDTGNAEQPIYKAYTGTQAACAQLYTTQPANLQAPLYSYDHSLGGAAAVAGAFYTGASYPITYYNALFITDYNRDWVKYLTFDGGGNAAVHDFAENISDRRGVVQVSLGPDEQLYYVVLNPGSEGEIRRILYTGDNNAPPTAQIVAVPDNGSIPLTVNFSGSGSSDPDQDAATLLYEWSFGDTFTSTEQEPSHTYILSGTYTAVLTVTDSYGVHDTDQVTIWAGYHVPTATITSPAPGSTYNAGDTIFFSGQGLDADQGMLPGDSLSWEMLLHHNQHVHPDQFHAVGSVGSFVDGDHGDNTWTELCLTVTDREGLQDTECIALYPNTVRYTFDTLPSGLKLAYAGIERTTPFTVDAVVNGQRLIVASPRQAGRDFAAWSDGGASSHAIQILTVPMTLTAEYRWLAWLPVILKGNTAP
jgi:glucose/arabinose dehydrogenase